MFKRFINILLSNNPEVLKILKYKSLGEIVLDTFPVRFVTQHTKDYEKSIKTKPITFFNIIRFWIGVYKMFFRHTIKIIRTKKFSLQKTKFEILFFLPNKKYENNLTAITNHLKVQIFIISEFRLHNKYSNALILDDHYFKGQFLLLIQELIFFTTYPIFLFLKRDCDEIKRLIANRSLYHLLFLNLFIFKKIFAHYKFEKYFSLLPNGDIHRIIQLYFKRNFSITYSIRPEQLVLAQEERYNISENLFYKNEFEKKIFRNLNLHRNFNLLKGSILIDKDILNNQRISKEINKILVLDTCTNANPKSDLIRDKGIKSIYSYLNKHLGFCNIYHKFHPGLNYKIQQETKLYLQKGGVNIIDTINGYCTFDLVITYYSSLLQHFILSNVPVLLLTGELDLSYKYKILEYDLDKSPIKKINTIENLNMTFQQISQAGVAEEICNTNKLLNWYKDFFNFPDGLNAIINTLNRIHCSTTIGS